jgi:hypothetical protein
MTIRISMWSGPRNISTTMMRAFENRPDTTVIDEPFYGAYLARTGAEHPLRVATLAEWPKDFRSALDWMSDEGGASIRFFKHIAYHLPADADLSFLREHRNFILIRDPRLMVASFAKKHDDIAPIVESYGVCRRIAKSCERDGLPCPAVDAADILADPPGMMRALCAALDIPFTERMLSWPPGPRPTDGPWAPHWYDAVNASTGFRKAAAPEPTLDPELERIAALASADYDFFHQRRLRTG